MRDLNKTEQEPRNGLSDLTVKLAPVENRKRNIGGKVIDRWFITGSGAMAPFWKTKEAAEQADNA